MAATFMKAEDSRILLYPNASKTQVTFSHAGDIFVAPITGGTARRITSHDGIELFPRFSPDGSRIAFSGEYDGNREVYIIPTNGGEPKRITYSMDLPGLPERMGPDKVVMQWTSDGKELLYRSREHAWTAWVGRLFFVSTEGGMPREVPLEKSGFACLSPDGTKLAFNRIFREFRTWKRYRGGQAEDLYIFDFKTGKVEKITDDNSQNTIPMWYKDKIYFASDRDKKMNIYCYDLKTKQTRQITFFKDYDVKFPSLGADNIAFENGGYVWILDLSTEKYNKLNIEIAEDFPEARTKYISVKDDITNFEIAPDGKRAIFGARGDVFTVPAEKGNTRNLTQTSGVHERNAVWSPDGKWIAYVGDATGENEIYIVNPEGGEPVRLTNGTKSYLWELRWSPDSKKILCSDKLMRLFYVDIDSKKTTEVAKSKVWEIRDCNWSPDSRYIAYTDYLESDLPVVFIYSLDEKKSYAVTDEYFESGSPVFSSCGKYLFFVSDRTYNASIGSFEWNFIIQNPSIIYGITLQKSVQSPFAFESDEVKIEEKSDAKDEAPKDKDSKKKDKNSKEESKNNNITIDIDGIKDRIIELPIEAANYFNLEFSGDKLYYVKAAPGKRPQLYAFDFKEKKESDVGDFSAYEISADGKKILFKQGSDYYITDLSGKVKADKGKLNLSDLTMNVDRKAEWKQIFDECWRQMRDFFYDPNMHGVDWKAMYDRYAAELPYVHNRWDLTYILGELIGELNIGHAYVGGGSYPEFEKTPIGLLGAEFELDKGSGFYKITKILEGRNWDEETRSPLTEPGIDIKAGDYLLEIDGVKLSAQMTPFMALVNKAGKYVALKVASKPNDKDAKIFNVKTIKNETKLRYFNWVENNRRYVEKATNGRVGYMHIPDMGTDNGLKEFIKYFYPQDRKEAMIVDDRYNGGGNVSTMIIERLRRILTISTISRNQERVGTKPDAVMTGPMVLLLNELSASDGDLFPYQFKKLGLGKLIGKRSWGGVIGIRGSLPLLDGGYLFKPEFANFGADGTWILEGVGQEPDIEVENDPHQEFNGVDAQLQRAIEEILKEIPLDKKPKTPKVPPYPDKK